MKNHTEIKHLSPNELVIHAELLRIYGDTQEKHDLQLDIEKNGIMVPLVASTRTSIITIVSGRCRLRAAVALLLESVPVICYQFPSEEVEKHFILSANRDRPKTKFQQLLEGKEWELLEKQAAAVRRQQGLKERWKDKDIEKSSIDNTLMQSIEGASVSHNPHNPNYYPLALLNIPSDTLQRSVSQEPRQSNKKQRATDKVGLRIGMSRHSYERGKRVIEKCEKLRRLGKEIEASALEVYLESAGIVPASNLLKAPNCDEVLELVGLGEAKTIKEALLKASRVNKASAVAEGAIFFFPDNMLRKRTYYHSGRVVRISNMTATVCFRDSVDDDLHEHQYKCDELLLLSKEDENLHHQRLRDRINRLSINPFATANDKYMLNRLLGTVVCTQDEVDWLQFIERRIEIKKRKQEVAV
ncbi:hypothetical protein NIES4071_103440 (plasmid) [Calothrix sp. NIES-4071]|nr:hypothetical protein NIES4071_103440 [Calothrix sp. NIES-4071]BAZ64331.1 hypothetical protein NIES4105_100640 [Calothrix sp. NIES-4105]